ncbi:MAG: acetylglutamate kinase [Muribaculaceae bacterium]|nr:acetylglutamate kinase [Muribaculaceae bacterium]
MSRREFTVVKIGGNVVDSPETLQRFVKEFKALPGLKLLVHGGGKEATRLSQRLGIPTTMIDGRRVTSRETLDVVTMVYAGLLNKRIVSMLNAAGCYSLGVSGVDGNSIRAVMRPKEPVDYGYVGDITSVDGLFILDLLQTGGVPVFCSITHDGKGTLLNCNADTIASAIATEISSFYDVKLIYCFEHPGVMADIDRPDSIIPEITPEIFENLKEQGVVSKGMIPKIQNALKAVEQGVKSVEIKHADNLNTPIGTTIRL